MAGAPVSIEAASPPLVFRGSPPWIYATAPLWYALYWLTNTLHHFLDYETADGRTTATSGLVVAAIGLTLTTDGLTDLSLPLSWACIGLAVTVSRKAWPRWWVLTLGTALPASIALSVPLAAHPWPTAANLVLVAPMLALLFVRVNDTFYGLLVVLALVNAASILGVGFLRHATLVTLGEGHRLGGLTANQNASAGLLVVAALYVLTTRYRWWALPLILAVPFTGSRWATAVLVMGLIGLLASRRLGVRFAAKLLLCALIAIVPVATLAQHNYRISATFGETRERIAADLGLRLRSPAVPGLVPHGAVEVGPNMVIPRIALEAGLLATLAWAGLTLGVLARQRFSGVWWVVWALFTLGLLDYYVWLGALTPLWWAVVGGQLHRHNGLSHSASG